MEAVNQEGLICFLVWKKAKLGIDGEDVQELVMDRHQRFVRDGDTKVPIRPPDCAGLIYLNDDGSIRLEQ